MLYANELMARLAYLVQLLIYCGVQEKTTWHLAIVAEYNKITPLPRGYEGTSSDSWCAMFVCGIAWALGFRSWPWECSCTLIRKEAKARGIWREGWSAMPKLGDWIIYDWGNNGTMDHIGAVCAIIGNNAFVVEGNYDDAVKIRRITVGDERVEGSVALGFTELVEIPTESAEALRPGDSGDRVRGLQVLLKGAGYYVGALDGDYGASTTAAVMAFQAANNLEADGKCGPKTQAKIKSGNFAVNTVKEVENTQTIYNTIEEIPEYARETIRKLIDAGVLKGTGDGLGLDEGLLRALVIIDRLGLIPG